MSTYKIDTEHAHDACIQLFESFVRQNPGLNVFVADFGRGSKLTIRVAKPKKPKATKP